MKKLTRLFTAVLFGLSLTACSEAKLDCCTPMPITAQIFLNISNEKAVDLLDQSQSEAFKIEGIKAFNVVNNKQFNINDANHPNKIILFPNDTLTSYSLNLSTELTNNKSRTIVKWDNQHVDTIDAVFFSEKATNRLSKVIVNGKEMLDTEKSTNNNFMYQIHLVK